MTLGRSLAFNRLLVKRALLILLVLTAAGACAPDKEGPITAVVIGIEAGEGFALRERTINTIESVADGRGGTAELIKEAKLTQDPNEEVDLLAIEFTGGEPVKILFYEDGDVVVPADYDSLVLLSFYSHLEDAVDYFRQTLGIPVDTPGFLPITTEVAPELGFLEDLVLSDNAAYLPTEHVFFVLPAFFFEDYIPLGANDGVVTHEAGHALFHLVLNGTNRLPQEYADEWSEVTLRYMSSMNEGLADVFAVMRIQDPNFIEPSIPGIEEERDASMHRVYTAEIRDNITQQLEGFSPYDLGAVLASAMWRIADDPVNGVGPDRAAQIAVNALEAMKVDATYQAGNVTIATYLNLVVAAATPGEEPFVCTVLQDQFALITGELTACP